MAVPFTVSVMPFINRVPLGETATFECMVAGDVHVEQYLWVGPEKIAKENRFSYSNQQRFLHVNNLKDYDNNTWVDCTVTAGGGRDMTANGKIVVLPSYMKSDRAEGMFNETMYNDTMTNEIGGEGKIPPITAGGGVVIGIGFILVILAMFGVLRWLKKKEMKKEEDLVTARNRYSRIEIGPSGRARYDRDQGSVNLGGGYGDEEGGVDDDSYEDMLPIQPKMRLPQPGSGSRGGPPRGGPPRDGGGYNGHGGPRYQPPPRN